MQKKRKDIQGTVESCTIGAPAIIKLPSGQSLQTSRVLHTIAHPDGKWEIETMNTIYHVSP